MASSVLPYHRLFRFRHNITASIFISSNISYLVAYDGLIIYHGYSAIPVSEASSHLYLGSVSRAISRLAEPCSLRKVSTSHLINAEEGRVNSAHEAMRDSDNAADIAFR